MSKGNSSTLTPSPAAPAVLNSTTRTKARIVLAVLAMMVVALVGSAAASSAQATTASSKLSASVVTAAPAKKVSVVANTYASPNKKVIVVDVAPPPSTLCPAWVPPVVSANVSVLPDHSRLCTTHGYVLARPQGDKWRRVWSATYPTFNVFNAAGVKQLQVQLSSDGLWWDVTKTFPTSLNTGATWAHPSFVWIGSTWAGTHQTATIVDTSLHGKKVIVDPTKRYALAA